MNQKYRRRDPLPAASELVLEVERLGHSVEGLRDGRRSRGERRSNVIPGRAALGLDVRHAEDATRERAVDELLSFARRSS